MSDPGTDPVAALRLRFQASFADKRSDLLTALAAWRDAPGAPECAASLYLLTHKLAGSAGAYGFDALSDLARIADRHLQEHVRDGATLSDPAIAAIEHAVLELCVALAHD